MSPKIGFGIGWEECKGITVNSSLGGDSLAAPERAVCDFQRHSGMKLYMIENTAQNRILPYTTMHITMPCNYVPRKQQQRTIDKKASVVEHYGDALACIAEACRAAGISRWTFYSWREKDPVFKKRLSMAIDKKINEITNTI